MVTVMLNFVKSLSRWTTACSFEKSETRLRPKKMNDGRVALSGGIC